MTLLDLPINKNQLEAHVCRQSFFDFFLRFWPVADPERLRRNWHIQFLCDELQIVAERVFARQPKEYDLVINICPGSTKSMICSVMFPAWCWLADPTAKFICASHGTDLANYLAQRTRDIVTSDKYAGLFPDTQLIATGIEMMYTTAKGWRNAVSVGQKPTGKHAHFHIVDDLVDPSVAYSDADLNAAKRFIDDKLASRTVDRAVTPLIMVMQRLSVTDPTEHVLKQAGRTVRHICIPAELGDGGNVKPRSLRKHYVGGLFDKDRFPREVLDNIKLQNEFTYVGQYLQRPSPAGGTMFKTEEIHIEQAAPSHFARTVVRYFDKAGSTDKPKADRRGAHTVGVKMGVDNKGRIWVLDVVRGMWEAMAREEKIKQTAIMDGKAVLQVVEQEPGSGGKESAQNTIRNLMGFRVMRDLPKGDKTLRAEPFATQVNAGNVYLVAGPWNAIYLNELQFFPFSQTKDQVDASSGAFAFVCGKRHVGVL